MFDDKDRKEDLTMPQQRLLRLRRIAGLFALTAGLCAVAARPASAQPGSHYFSVEVDSDCSCHYQITAWGWAEPNASITINYSFTVSVNGVDYPVSGQLFGNADMFGAFNIQKLGLDLPGGCGQTSTFSNGSAHLAENVGPPAYDAETFQFSPSPLECGGTPPPPGKSFSIGPQSMEGHILIRPGDWVSGGFDFSFADGGHIATTLTVTSSLTVPFKCADSSTGQFVVNLGTHSYNVPAGNTQRLPTADANSILSWMGSVQAPAGCGPTGVMDNSKGAIFNATVSQNPDTGSLIKWQFKYRDPNAKGKGNVNCLDASDPRRNDAATCGASWSATITDP
jgi:hypothetical protein